MVCYSIIDSFNVCVGFVNPLTTVTNLQENQEKFHGFSTFRIIILVYFFGIFVASLLNKIWYGTPVSLWSSREPPILCIYHTPQTQLAQLRKNGETHTKNREIRDPYPTPGFI